MADPVNVEEELVDYEEEEATEADAATAKDAAQNKKGYVGIHATGFKDFLLKPELLRAIQDCGFEHPSEGAPLPPCPCWACWEVDKAGWRHFLTCPAVLAAVDSPA